MLVFVYWWYFYDYVDIKTIGFEKLGSNDSKTNKRKPFYILILATI